MRILNLTQHMASPEQIEAGVVEPNDKFAVKELLTFNEVPHQLDIMQRARELANMALRYDGAMIGGEGYLLCKLEPMLLVLGVEPLHAFSVRESVEELLPDGSIKKTMIFRHAGFVSG